MTHAHGALPENQDFSRAFLVGTVLNVAFVVVEAAFGVFADSAALLADAAHNLGDVLGLALAWGAATLARRAPSTKHTYGLRRSTVLAALTNAVLLLAIVGAVAWEAVGRLAAPSDPEGPIMVAVAAVGVGVNGLSALLLSRGRHTDVNVRAAFLHLFVDAVVSVAVVVAGGLVWATGFRWIDPVTSLAVSAAVLVATWRLLVDALHLSLDGVPTGIDLGAVRSFLAELPGVLGVHDLHVWALGTSETALTVHLVVPWSDQPPSFLSRLDAELERRFGIAHATVQLEPAENHACARLRLRES